MRDMAKLTAKGVGRSRGYGFVAFTEHEHALACLRNLNNNPDIFSNNKVFTAYTLHFYIVPRVTD